MNTEYGEIILETHKNNITKSRIAYVACQIPEYAIKILLLYNFNYNLSLWLISYLNATEINGVRFFIMLKFMMTTLIKHASCIVLYFD